MPNLLKDIKTILLAEDDEDDIYLFKMAVGDIEKDIQIRIAGNGIECMKILTRSSLPDLVFLDINMPMKSGLDVLEEIRSEERLKGLTVIVLSTASSQQVINQAYTKGADLYIPKGVSYEQFKSLLANVLARHRSS
jgi:CheY-like chemotaxis protein